MESLCCPKCGNSHQTLFIDKTEVSGKVLKAICCPQCGVIHLITDLSEIMEKLESIEDRLSCIEDELR